MPNPLSDTITNIFPSLKRSARVTELEQAANATADDLKKRTADRRDRNTETRTNMRTREVQGSCDPV